MSKNQLFAREVKSLLLAVLLCVPMMATAQGDIAINEANFPDASFRSWLLEQPYGQDGVLSEDEIAEITDIDILWRGIGSLKGIQHFTALETLWCSGNQLTSLDVSQNVALSVLGCGGNQLTALNLSNNKKLKILECSNNPLTTLNLSENTALTSLNCSGLNLLGSIDVSMLTKLEELRCEYIGLTSLDVSANPALTTLVCGSNQLTSLDLSNNKALTELHCGINQLTTLDLSNNTSLTVLDCGSNPLTNFDASAYPALTELRCSGLNLQSLDLSKHTGLMILECSYNEELKSLDVSQNTKLTTLYCYNIQLTSLDLSNNAKLVQLHCNDNKLTELDLSKNVALRNLNCANNQLTSLVLSSNAPLTDISCQRNQIKGDAMDVLISSLPQMTGNIKYHLNIAEYPKENNICTKEQVLAAKEKGWTAYYLDESEGWEWKEYEGWEQAVGTDINEETFPDENFRNFLLETSYGADGVLTDAEIERVTSIDASNKNIRSLQGIERFTNLTSLNCSNNYELGALNVSMFEALTELRCNNIGLTSLDLSKNTALTTLECGDNQLTALDLTNNVALTEVSCYRNQIKDEAMTALISSLPANVNGRLNAVRFPREGNRCTKEQVATAKEKGWTVYYLDESEEYWEWKKYEGWEQAEGLAISEENFPDNTFRSYLLDQPFGADEVLTDEEIANIKEIDVSWRDISSLEGIQNFTALEILRCGSNQLTSLDLSQNTALTVLDCSNMNQLGSIDVSMLENLTELRCGSIGLTSLDVSANTKLTVLDCGNNKLTSLDLSKNEALTELRCGSNQLTTLDIPQAETLTVLDCGYNPLTNFEASAYPALTELRCGGLNLQSLDLSKNTALKILDCSNNNELKSLDVSENAELTELQCYYIQLTTLDLSKNTKLEQLLCNENQLTELNLSQNGELRYLNCANNQLTSLILSSNAPLTEIYCQRNQIKGEAMDSLISSLPEKNVGNKENCRLYVAQYPRENNICIPDQVAAAKEKGWTVYYRDESDGSWEWKEYEGWVQAEGLPIDETTFPDENFRNYLLEQSFGADGVLTDEEIAKVARIDVSNRDIHNLQGIEIFTALTELRCSSNQLKSLDLPQATALTVLDCSNNPLLDFDASNYLALTELRCSSLNLQALNLSKNTTLRILDCSYNNELQALDVSENTELTELYCNRIQLTTLDLSKNTKLEQLLCNENQLTELNLSQNGELRYLNCANNQLTSLDFSGNAALTEIYCQRNQIKGDAMDSLISSLPECVNGHLNVVRYPSEGNRCTKEQVKAANAKGWTVYYLDESEEYWDWKEYEGMEQAEDGIAISEENFPDVAFRKYLLEQSFGMDDMLTNEEIEKITKMEIWNRGIGSLKGIEYFTALEVLWCNDNQLTELDLSKNTALTSLNCNYNNELGSLDVSMLENLTELQCNGIGLTSLDVSHNGALEVLACSVNQLTELDLSNNPKLRSLDYSYNNELGSLDVSKFTGLTELGCSGTRLTELNVSQNTALEVLDCSSNQLTELDLSNNPNLRNLNCSYNELGSLDVSMFADLTVLRCSGIQLTTLDVSKNSKLTDLSCYDNRLTVLDLSQNPALRYLYCQNNQLTSLIIPENSNLMAIECYQNQIKGKAMDALISNLPVNTAERNDWDYRFRVYYEDEKYPESENNVCTKDQVAAIKAKGWTPWYTTNGWQWIEYEGSDAEPVVTVTVTVDANGLATYCPETGVDFSNATEIAAYKASVSDNIVTLTRVETVAAGEGVLIRSLSGSAVTEELHVADNATANTDNAFVGTLTDITLAETEDNATNFVLSNVDGIVGFFKANNTLLAAGKAYLPVENYNASRGLSILFDDGTTGIIEIAPEQSTDAIYTLGGVRIKTPAKGLYIKNGKKVIIK